MLKKLWTEQDDAFLKQAVAEGVSLQRLAIRLNRRPAAVLSRANALGLKIAPVQRLAHAERYAPGIIANRTKPSPPQPNREIKVRELATKRE